jgi:hypothetical protein
MRCGFTILLLALCLGSPLHAQENTSPVPHIPDEESPFFVLREEFRQGAVPTQRRISEGYPRSKGADVNAGKIFTGFFTDMFASVKFGTSEEARASSQLTVEPKTFSLDDRREFTVNYVVTNKTDEIIKLNFPNAQRIEITVTDPTGKVIERWSDDRFFAEVTGVVMVNPGERIEYVERIPTREMQPGRTYIVEATIPNYPDFARSTQLTPTGSPIAAPTPAPEAPSAEATTPSNPAQNDRDYL